MEIQKELQCSICLDVFRSPVSTECGHTFCSDCISKHWDRESSGSYSCPECRREFPKRPQLAKNIRLCQITEAWKRGRVQDDPGVSAAPSPRVSADCSGDLGRFCQIHHWELELYCHTEGVAICRLCHLQDHQTHQTGELKEEAERARERIMKYQALVDLQHQATVNELSAWKDTITTQQGWLHQLREEVHEEFEEVLRTLRKTEEQLGVFLHNSEGHYLEQAEAFRKHLQDKLLHLQHQHHLLHTLLKEDRAIALLQGAEGLRKSPDVPLEQAEQPELPQHLSQLTAATKVLSDLLREQLQAFTQLNIPTGEFPGAEAVTVSVSSPGQRYLTPPQTRQDLMRYFSVVTFDPNTASDWLLLSDDLQLVTNQHPKNQNHPRHSDRFTRQHQVLGIQEFTSGVHYWEVSVSGGSVRVGLAYRQINRTDRGSASILGENAVSWCLELDQGSGVAWHDNRKSDPVPSPYQCLGLLLDFPSQTLSFYGIREQAILLLHQFQTGFSQGLLPAFWVSRNAKIRINNKSQKPARQTPIGNRS
ncbi:tripartite motif-containing protein 16-like protein isoform X2 [Hemiscyllium ocellatum]|uniref:tripartite motif-containing protein 16-like protein isoform X2 n=1 Tax=Hemiscyllium ocellatum TaxID=170820 RepID=UPI0029674397|nr:tripartite motif-containing protein 16-like protein isoform X2 [Hemiscyllium ocellatum]